MPRRSGIIGPPAAYIAGGEWPDGALRTDAPVAVTYARRIAIALRNAMADRNVSVVADQAGIARSTVYDVMSGQTFPDLVTLAKLEELLQVRLWPESADPR